MPIEYGMFNLALQLSMFDDSKTGKPKRNRSKNKNAKKSRKRNRK